MAGMDDDSQTRQLLTDIRDDQRESLALQKEAIERQRSVVALYRWVVFAGGMIVAGLLVLVVILAVIFLNVILHLPSR
jgi:CHASE3 domain sensor protein